MGGVGDPRWTRAACGSCQRRRRSGAEASATVHSRPEEAGTDSPEEAGAAGARPLAVDPARGGAGGGRLAYDDTG